MTARRTRADPQLEIVLKVRFGVDCWCVAAAGVHIYLCALVCVQHLEPRTIVHHPPTILPPPPQVKQADAPAFAFLQPDDPLHAYYCFMRDAEREPGEDYTMDEEAKARAQGN